MHNFIVKYQFFQANFKQNNILIITENGMPEIQSKENTYFCNTEPIINSQI